ncbi:MAG: SDR family oxidoreductase [Devosia sp.]|nr:SDR family oxidoreductase [Devosia sp.]
MITGAAGGIGMAAAERFLSEGASVMLADRDGDALSAAAAKMGPKTAYCILDVTEPTSGAALVHATTERFGPIDAAVLNAGIEGSIGPICEQTLEDFDRVMAINVRGVWIGLVAVMKAMTASGGGSIVITASTAGMRGSPGLGPYVASKHAVIGLARTAALEGASANIRVNTVNPAPIDTRMMVSISAGRNGDDPEEARRLTESGIPLGRYGTPAEVASMMTYLISDEAAYCTGGIYTVDGGLTAGPKS